MKGRLLLLATLACAASAGDQEEERAFLDLQARLAAAEPAAVIEDAERFRSSFPASRFLPAVDLAEREAHRARGEMLLAELIGERILAHAPESVAARAVLKSFSDTDDCTLAISHLVEAYLATGDAARLASLRRLIPVALALQPDLADDADFVFPAWALLLGDEGMSDRLEDAAVALGAEHATLVKLLRLARGKPVPACADLQVLPEASGPLCAAILVGAGALGSDPSPAARLIRARAELCYRGRTDPGPLLEPPPETAEQATIAALALISVGRREEARALAARELERLVDATWTPAIAQVEKLLSYPPTDVARLVDEAIEPALRDLLQAAPRWEIHIAAHGTEATLFLDFPGKECEAIVTMKGQTALMLHGRAADVRYWFSGERCIHLAPWTIPAPRFEIAPGEAGLIRGHFEVASEVPWTEARSLGAALRSNPLFSTKEGIAKLVTWPPGLVVIQRTGTTCRWTRPAINTPGFTTLEMGFEKGRIASLHSSDGSSLALRYGDEVDVPGLLLQWPDLPERKDNVDYPSALAMLYRLAAEFGLEMH